MLNYIKKGNGPITLVFIHGNSSSINYWSSVMQNNVSEKFTCIAVNLPGHGNSNFSSTPEQTYTHKGMANELDHFLQNVVDTDYILIGHSLGCNVIGELNFENNTHCKGIFLTSPSIIGKALTPQDIMLPNPLATPLFLETPTSEEVAKLMDELSRNNAEIKTLLIEDYIKTDPKVRTTLMHSVINNMLCDEITAIEKLNIPIGIVFGKEDSLLQIQYLNNIDLKLYNDSPILIENAGHYLQFDQPEKMNALYFAFVNHCLVTS